DGTPACTQCAASANLARAFLHAHIGDVHDTDCPHKQGKTGDGEASNGNVPLCWAEFFLEHLRAVDLKIVFLARQEPTRPADVSNQLLCSSVNIHTLTRLYPDAVLAVAAIDLAKGI